MAASTQSFIDIAALDAVRRHFAAGDSIVVLTNDLTQVVWANGPGAALLGFPGIEAAIGADSGLGRSARRQIEATPGYPDIGSDRPITVRLATGLISQVTAFRASRLSLPGDETAIMLVVPFGAGASRSEEEIAERAISGFDEPGNYLALLDANGRLLAATPGFAQLAMEDADLARLARDMTAQNDRLLKRIVRVAGHAMPVGVARLCDKPVLNLLVTVDERQMPAEPLDAPATVVDDSQVAVAVLAEPGQEAAAISDDASNAVDEHDDIAAADRAAAGTYADEEEVPLSAAEASAVSELAEPQHVPASPAPSADAGDMPAAAPGSSTGETAVAESDTGEPIDGVAAGGGDPSSAKPGQLDAWYFSDGANRPDKASRPEPVRPAGSGAAPQISTPEISRAAAPVRFVWRTDVEGRFTSVSPEFVAAVGASAADITGRSFAEVARSLALDPDGDIAALLERRDTWSGRSVLWPIAGTALMAPVDLAALPAYDRERRFEGFRGFGVVRLADAVADPRRTGLALIANDAVPAKASEEAASQTSGEDAAEAAEDPFKGEVPVLDVAGKPRERRHSDKVIRLAEHRAPANDKRLSPLERIAFREIGEHLKRASGEMRPDAAEQEQAESVEAPPGPQENEERAAAPPAAGGGDSDGSTVHVQASDTSEQVENSSAPQLPPPVAPIAESEDGDAPSAEAVDDSAFGTKEAGASDAAPTTDHELDQDEKAGEEGSGREASPADEPTAEHQQSGAEAPDVEATHGDERDEAIAAQEGAAGGGTEAFVRSGPSGEATTGREQPPADRQGSAIEAGAADEAGARPFASRSLFDFVDRDARPTGGVEASSPVASVPAAAEAHPARQAGFMPSAFAERRVDTSILSQLPIPVLIHSGDTLHYANDAFFHLTGYQSIGELAAQGGIGALLSGPAEDRREGDNRVMLRSRDGGELSVSAFLQSVPWIGGKALLLTLTRQPAPAAVDDAAAREKELEARVAELRTILDTATDGVVLIDNDGIVRSISRPAEALFGYDGEQVVGKPFTALFAVESQRSAQDYLSGLSGTGVASVLNDGREVIGREAQGRFIPLFMTIGRLPGDGGYCAVLRDITQWKRAEEDLTQARAQAERTSSQKSDFLARVSHEIRTPLNAIIGFSELMLDEKFGPIANDRYRDYLRDINRSGNHVLDLVNDLLDISKIEAGQQEMDYEAISLNDALTETVAMMQPQANRERVIIRSSLASKLPEVVADLRSVRQIALNILSNAVRYTQAGGQVIVSTAYEPNGEVVMRVRDTGIGMTPSEIEQALKPFKQVNALKRARGDGTGLGLPLTKAMVEANRAKFAIYSTPGEGTLVEVTFPSTRVLAG